MYENYYGLVEKPFSLLPDPEYLYLSRHHQKALTLLEYGILNQAGFCVVSGQAGTGKTTLIRYLLNRFDKDTTIGLLSNTHDSFEELLAWILMAFDLPYQNKTKTELYQCFIDFLIQQYANKCHTVLIIDEAQNMSPAALEELRMLSNVNADKDQLLQMILMGQPKLLKNLQRPELRQFAQRIAVDYRLEVMSKDETCAYIHHRLKVAGAKINIFDDGACQAVYEHSRGLPRLINLLCDTALVYTYAENVKEVNKKIINDVVKERDENTILPHYHELNEEKLEPEIEIMNSQIEEKLDVEEPADLKEITEIELGVTNKMTSCGETTSCNESSSASKIEAASDNKIANKPDNVSSIQTASVTSLKQAEYFSKAMNLQHTSDSAGPNKKTHIENDRKETLIDTVEPVNDSLFEEKSSEPVIADIKSNTKAEVSAQTDLNKGASKLGFVILGFAFGLLISIAVVMLYKMDNVAAPMVNKDEITGRMKDIEDNFARKLQAIQLQRERDLEKSKIIVKEKEASLEQAASLERERDAALAIARAREELLQAKLEAQRAIQKEQKAKEQTSLALERARAAEFEAKLSQQREVEASLEASRIKQQSVQKAAEKSKALPVEVMIEAFPIEEPESAEIISTTTNQKKQPTKDKAKAAGFVSNLCDGPTAVLLSTCKK